VPVTAFAGALASVVAVYHLASAAGRARTTSLFLSGVAVRSVAGTLAAMILSIAVADWELGRQMRSWMLGGLEVRTWWHVAVVAPPVVTGTAMLAVHARALDALALGEKSAAGLGVDVLALRRAVLALVPVSTRATVAVMGTIGLLGPIAPPAVLLLAGA
jgi:iron complex transport system permease protein